MDDMNYLLGQETTALESLLAALRDELNLLKAGDADAMASVIDRKNRQFETLFRCGRRRDEILASQALRPGRPGLVEWGRRTGKETLVSAMLALCDETRELNRLNGQLIALRLQCAQSALAALKPDRASQGLYGRSGKTSFATGYRLIDAA